MNWAPDNPDRNFRAAASSDDHIEDLRELLASSEVAEYVENTMQRVGSMISNAILDPKKQLW